MKLRNEILSLWHKTSSALLKKPLRAQAKWYGEVKQTLDLLVRSSELHMQDILYSKRMLCAFICTRCKDCFLEKNCILGYILRWANQWSQLLRSRLLHYSSAWLILVWNFQYYKKIACYQMNWINYL